MLGTHGSVLHTLTLQFISTNSVFQFRFNTLTLVLVQRRIQVVGERGTVVQRQINALSEWPGTLEPAYDTVQQRLDVTTKAPQSGRHVSEMVFVG